MSGLLIEGAGLVATLAGGLRRGASQGELAIVEGPASVAVLDDRILALGPGREVAAAVRSAGHDPAEFRRLDSGGRVVTPGLVDAHTHLVFAGTREREWQMRAAGAGYLDILAAGGGILSTVAATRDAGDAELLAAARGRLAQMLANGTTTAEAKSGYALDTAGELRTLELIGRMGAEGPIELVPTYLGAHAVPADLRENARGTELYIERIVAEQLPAVAAQGIARFCDVFCENGVFSADQTRRILTAAREHGLALRLHADELAPSGGAELAAELAMGGADCLSADHLAAPSEAGIAALARAAEAGTPVVATLLPATSWFLGKHHFAPARRFIEAGVPIALATDLNPGTSPTLSLPFVMSIACLEMGLTPAQALAAVTINAAFSVGLADRIGSLEPGKQADLVIWDVAAVEQIPYWLGRSLVSRVVKRGRVVFDRASSTGSAGSTTAPA